MIMVGTSTNIQQSWDKAAFYQEIKWKAVTFLTPDVIPKPSFLES